MSGTRGILRAMTITGGTQALSVILSIARMKVLALLLGPVGVGILSLYTSLQSTASAVAGLGLNNSGVRQIAQARGDAGELSKVRRVLVAANLLQGALAMVGIWVFRERLADWLFGKSGYGFEVGLVGIAVFFTVIAGSQTALLRGMRRVGDLGKVTVLGALAATVGGIAAVWAFGKEGLLWFVLLQPITAVGVAAFYTRRLPVSDEESVARSEILKIWGPMVRLGLAFMFSALATALTLLLVRGMVADRLGLAEAGQFAAAWGITMTYVGFLLNAMGLDFYPHLAEIVHDRAAANRLVNEQAQISIAIGGPVLLALIGLAPIAIAVLYSTKFAEAITLLQWQTAGNVFKIISWPLGFILMAAARSKLYLATQLVWNFAFVGLICLGLPVFGLEITGIAFLASYVLLLAFVWALVRTTNDFRWERLSLLLMSTHAICSTVLLVVSFAAPFWGAVLSIMLAATTGFVGGHILLEKIGPGRYTAPLARIYAFCRWPISEHQ